MRFEQPDAPSALPKSATALSVAVYEYQQKADKYHQKALKIKTASKDIKETLEKEWVEARQYLDELRKKVLSLADMEDHLASYRNEFSILDSEQRLAKMRAEKHHPTTVLRDNLIRDSDPPPSERHVPHHIVMGKGRWQKRAMMIVRLRLFDAGIRINDSRNGVWLHPDKADHWANADSPIHNPLHGYNYETWIIANMKIGLTDAMFEQKLKEVKGKLKFGGYPDKILEAKDASWSGIV